MTTPLLSALAHRQILLSRITTNAIKSNHFSRTISSTTPTLLPLDEFLDPQTIQKRSEERVGRSWTVKELRRKSFDDLHKLWYVLYKERNMLFTEANLARRKGYYLPQPDRARKVKKSMAAIKVVLGERKRDYMSQEALESMEDVEDVDDDSLENEIEEKKS